MQGIWDGSQYRVRVADTEVDGFKDDGYNDHKFIVDCFDSAIPHLQKLGSGQQWGPQLFSEKENFITDIGKMVQESRKCVKLDGEDGPEVLDIRVFVAEILVQGKEPDDLEEPGPRYTTTYQGAHYLSLGALIIRDKWLPTYIDSKSQPQFREFIHERRERGDFMYVQVLVSDCREHEMRKGVGTALIERAKEFCAVHGRSVLLVDCWSGNGGKLVR